MFSRSTLGSEVLMQKAKENVVTTGRLEGQYRKRRTSAWFSLDRKSVV